jgi:hypothetical protein
VGHLQRQIRRYCIGASARAADFRHHGVGLIRRAPVMDENVCAGRCQRERRRTADAA